MEEKEVEERERSKREERIRIESLFDGLTLDLLFYLFLVLRCLCNNKIGVTQS